MGPRFRGGDGYGDAGETGKGTGMAERRGEFVTTRPVTLEALQGRLADNPGLADLSALALIWGLVHAIADTPPDAIDGLLAELTDMPEPRHYPR